MLNVDPKLSNEIYSLHGVIRVRVFITVIMNPRKYEPHPSERSNAAGVGGLHLERLFRNGVDHRIWDGVRTLCYPVQQRLQPSWKLGGGVGWGWGEEGGNTG